MFGNRNRRRAASNPPLHGSNASASATTAAASAFLKNSSSTASLSSAAAAAALRARPTTPISVADVQTKRTLRRAGSTSSAGSMGSGSARGLPGSQLQRRGSSGSMSERSFREPSPARSPSRSSQPLPSDDAPPVPAIPKNILSHRRSSSLQAPPMRVASPPPISGGRGSSLGAQSRRSGQRTSLSSVEELPSIDRPASRGSVNFSLPTGSRPSSPNPQWSLTSSLQSARSPVIVSPTNQNLVYDPNTRSFLPEYEILAIEQRIRNATNQPVQKKKRIAPKQATGTHLANGTVGGRPRGTAVDAMEAKLNEPSESIPIEQPTALPEQTREPSPTPAPVAEAPRRRRRMKMVMVSDSDSDGDLVSHDPVSSDTDTDVVTQPRAYTPRPTAALSKKPSIVREEREPEEEEEDTLKSKARESLIQEDASPLSSRNASPSPMQISTAGKAYERGQASSPAPLSQVQNHARSDNQPPPANQTNITNGISEPSILPDKARGDRVQSVSPARNAHFAHEPNNLVVKHNPPLRSISPRKSALKSTSILRESSPSADIPRVDNQNASEVSDELSVPRKKAHRVSFDERNVIVGEAAPSTATSSPIVQSPQATKRPWYSIHRGKRKENSVLDIDDDEVMKPRPALPSFGSVREKKAQREVQERPLVKPATPQEYAPPPSPPLFSTTTTEAAEYPTGLSNDHVAGALLSQDAATKNTANISKSREPLPPQVTSVEGNGYFSDSSSVYSLEAGGFGQGTNDTSHDESTSNVGQHDETSSGSAHLDSIQPALSRIPTNERPKTLGGSARVPQVSAIPPPPVVTVTSPPSEWPEIPGGWKHFNSESDGEAQVDKLPTLVEKHAIPPTPASVGVAEPTPEVPQPGSPVLGHIAAENSQSPANHFATEDSEESDDNSIYSDAAEDLSDLEGDGFLSLDAIVDSPMGPTSQVGIAITAPESPTPKSTKQRAYRLVARPAEPEPEAGWQKAQEYWKGLSTEKKRQLELEAMAERDSSESEVEVKSAPNPKKNKAAIKAAGGVGSEGSERHRSSNNERSYMISPGTKADTSHSIPAELADTHMRKSMRDQRATRGSLRGPLQKRHRHTSNLPPELKADPATVDALIKKLSAERAIAASAASGPTAAPNAPALRRQGSADSESSFKRARQANTSDIPAFRNSMRGIRDENPGGRNQSPAGTRRFSLRSLSPASSNFRQTMSPPPSQMRSSMRNAIGPAPTLRGNNPPSGGKSAFRLPGFGRSGPPKQATRPRSGPMRTSRFADSSDEEDSQPAFRSRFVESSDEEDEPLPRRAPSKRFSAPVSGIPERRSAENVESSDLPDSDDEASAPVQKRAQNGVITKPQAQNGTAKPSAGGPALASGSLRRSGSGRGAITPIVSSGRPDKTRRGSIISILRRKKPDPSSKVRKSDAESAARRDTPLERSRSDLAIVRSGSMSPRLQKKNPYLPTRSQSVGGSWPLASNEEGAPFGGDAEGIETAITGGDKDTRPGMGSRRSTAASKIADVGFSNGVGVDGMKKKKKFGALRRMFKLDD
ncbi:uncharacterized protein BP5553_01485 [Venustampulla echinocandica]|uniref:Uncharacterized protein n=1 Tax=Venustampulla echinocandica TaxID=2656787 RepID=A0A370U151_9HELO|nr:uncharacterized protein BP5553_01485 [Venustampulla echinocandica]RDL41506.1 hypothetical protein BP5553_01485 [Venustampulla echinocandica]